MVAQRRRRWATIKPALGQRRVRVLAVALYWVKPIGCRFIIDVMQIETPQHTSKVKMTWCNMCATLGHRLNLIITRLDQT